MPFRRFWGNWTLLAEPPTIPADAALVDRAPCALLLTALDGVILKTNATFKAWFGLPEEEVIGKRRLSELFTVGGRIFYQTHCAPLLQMQGSIAEVKLDLVHQDGRKIPVLLNAVRHREEQASYYIAAMVIVSDRHKFENELLKARNRMTELNDQLSLADRRKDEFLATLAHELRNPLAPMRNVVHLARQGQMNETQRDWAIQLMDRQLQHMTHLVDDLLEISRISQGKVELRKQTFAINQAIQSAVEAVQPIIDGFKHELTLDIPEAPIYIDGDLTRMSQVIQNLLNNAAKYTPPGGKIRLGAARVGDQVRISVCDSGIGISKTDLGQLFQIFSQLNSGKGTAMGGLGIGLALVKGIAELHGGTVTASSPGEGKGSEFVVSLPAGQSSGP